MPTGALALVVAEPPVLPPAAAEVDAPVPAPTLEEALVAVENVLGTGAEVAAAAVEDGGTVTKTPPVLEDVSPLIGMTVKMLYGLELVAGLAEETGVNCEAECTYIEAET